MDDDTFAEVPSGMLEYDVSDDGNLVSMVGIDEVLNRGLRLNENCSSVCEPMIIHTFLKIYIDLTDTNVRRRLTTRWCHRSLVSLLLF